MTHDNSKRGGGSASVRDAANFDETETTEAISKGRVVRRPRSREKPSYETGYGKPPKKHQFKKGQSGNPKGRPKKSRNFKTILDEALSQSLTVRRKNGKAQTMTAREAVIARLLEKAISGDRAAIKILIELSARWTDSKSETTNEDNEKKPRPLSPADEEILENFANTVLEKGRNPFREGEDSDDPEPEN